MSDRGDTAQCETEGEAGLVEALFVSFIDRGVEFVDRHVGSGLVCEDFSETRQCATFNSIGVVENRAALHGFAALQTGSLDVDEDAGHRRCPVDGAGFQTRIIVDQLRLAADAQGFNDARNHEKQRNVRVPNEIRQRIETVVSFSIRDQQRRFVEDLDRTRWIASRRDVQRSVFGTGRKADIGRQCDHRLAVLVQFREEFLLC